MDAVRKVLVPGMGVQGLTISMGCVFFETEDKLKYPLLYRYSDELLYRVKYSGRNGYELRTYASFEEKKNEICRITKENESLIQTEKELKVKLETLQQSKEKMNTLHKTFFERRDEIANNVTNLEKEVLRLESTKEKLDILSENITNYIWDEYELTYHSALPFRNEELNNINDIKKNISELKDEIKSLGNVNVNAIEDYKQVSERY